MGGQDAIAAVLSICGRTCPPRGGTPDIVPPSVQPHISSGWPRSWTPWGRRGSQPNAPWLISPHRATAGSKIVVKCSNKHHVHLLLVTSDDSGGRDCHHLPIRWSEDWLSSMTKHPKMLNPEVSLVHPLERAGKCWTRRLGTAKMCLYESVCDWANEAYSKTQFKCSE